MRMNNQQIKLNIPKDIKFVDDPVEVVSMIKIVDHLAQGSNQDLKAEQLEDL